MKVVEMSTVSDDAYILFPDSVNQGHFFLISRDFKELGFRPIMKADIDKYAFNFNPITEGLKAC